MNDVMLLWIALGISLASNIVLAAMLRGMVPPEIARLLASNVPRDFVEEQATLLRERLLRDDNRWNDVVAYLVEPATEAIIDSVQPDDDKL